MHISFKKVKSHNRLAVFSHRAIVYVKGKGSIGHRIPKISKDFGRKKNWKVTKNGELESYVN